MSGSPAEIRDIALGNTGRWPGEGAREAGCPDVASLEAAAEQMGGRGGGRSWEEVEEERREAIELEAV